MYLSLEELKKATELTRSGDLAEATRRIQAALQGGAAPAPAAPVQPEPRPDVTDVAFRELPRQQAAGTMRTGSSSTFTTHRFVSGGVDYRYRLYVPATTDDTPLPVLVMLHGCTQDATDFATGTAMNERAAQCRCIVVYPEQPARSNSMRCWNWFEPAHQQRGRGEPAMIAALAAHVVARSNGDPHRVYVAGLSAGAAMAVLVAQLYPEAFAAVGVHSGLPARAAGDVASAQAAMRRPGRRTAPAAGPAVPTIVLHGRSDRVVHPENGRQVIAEAAARAAAAGQVLAREEQQLAGAARADRRTLYKDPAGVVHLEHWEIAGAHAWSGGSASGTHTNPSGPDASAAMLDFFLAHRLAPAPAPA